MSSNNNNNDAAIGFAVVFAILGIIGIFVYAVLVFVSFVLTLLCIIAWSAPLRLGKFILEPQEARGFIVRGLIGMVMLPCFGAFCEAMFNFQIDPEFWPHLIIGGYALGSLGIAILMADNEPNITPMPPPAQPPAMKIIPPEGPRPGLQHEAPRDDFRFASWDDEE